MGKTNQSFDIPLYSSEDDSKGIFEVKVHDQDKDLITKNTSENKLHQSLLRVLLFGKISRVEISWVVIQ